MLSFILLLILLCFIIIRYLKVSTNYWKKRNVKQSDGLLWKFLTSKKTMFEIVKEIYDAHPKLPYVGIICGTKPFLILRDMENIQTVLHGNFESFFSRDLLTNDTDVLSNNLFFVDDINQWKLMRQKLTPFLTVSNLRNMYYITVRCTRDLVKFLEENPHFIKNPCAAIRIYAETCIKSKVFGIDKETHNVVETLRTETDCQILRPSVHFKMSFILTNLFPKLYRWLNLKVAGTYEDQFIQMVKKAMDKRRQNQEIHHDFIDTCLKIEEQGIIKDNLTGYETNVTLQFLAAQAYTIFIGGVDTITTVLNLTLMELSNNSVILKKVHDEIDRILKNDYHTVALNVIDKFEYLGKVLQETMRKYPPIGVTQRKCDKDIILPVGNVKIEKGTNVVIPIYAIHRDSNYFPNPDVFDPERFSTENVSKVVKYTYMPFGQGKRTCIGTRLSFMDMKTCLVCLLHKYTLKQQRYSPKFFDSKLLVLHDPEAHYELVLRT